MKNYSAVGACALILGMTACATPPRFEWGNYEQALYHYSKSADARPEYQQALETAIARGRASNRLAPGLQAELGYLKLRTGDTAGAVTLFQAEAESFPESRPFMTHVITRLSVPGTSEATPSPDASAATSTAAAVPTPTAPSPNQVSH